MSCLLYDFLCRVPCALRHLRYYLLTWMAFRISWLCLLLSRSECKCEEARVRHGRHLDLEYHSSKVSVPRRTAVAATHQATRQTSTPHSFVLRLTVRSTCRSERPYATRSAHHGSVLVYGTFLQHEQCQRGSTWQKARTQTESAVRAIVVGHCICASVTYTAVRSLSSPRLGEGVFLEDLSHGVL